MVAIHFTKVQHPCFYPKLGPFVYFIPLPLPWFPLCHFYAKKYYDSYLSLLVLILYCHALKPLLVCPAKTDTGIAAFMCCIPHVAHIIVSQMVHDSPPGFSPSFHTTSGTVGPTPNSGGGLCHCTLKHISYRTLHKSKTDHAGSSPSVSEQPEMFVMH